MNGYEFKREVERIFKVARNMYPNVTDEMLDTNGAIHYCCTKSEMRRIIDRDTYDRLRNYDMQTKELEKSNELMSGFIKRMGKQFEEMFNKYVKEIANE